MTDEPEDFQPPPHPLERAWIHPSELGLARGRIPTAPVATPPRGRSRTVIVASGVAAAIVAAAVIGISISVDESPRAQARLGAGGALPVAFGGSEPEQSIVTVDAETTDATTRGSGVAVGNGIVVTSGALLTNATAVRVNGTQATVVTADPITDIAVLRTTLSLPPALLATNPPSHAGDRIALMARSANADGIVLARDVTASSTSHLVAGLLHTDMTHPSDAVGAATVDNQGAVTGIVSGLRLRTSGALVIPIDAVREVLDQVRRTGTVRHGWLGIAVTDTADGPTVQSIAPTGPAAASAIRVGDTVEAVAGQPTTTTAALLAVSRSLTPGATVTLTVARDQGRLTITMRAGTAPPTP